MTRAQSEELAQKIARRGARELIAAMLLDAESKGKNADDSVRDVMSSLEEMGNTEPDVACCLMLALYPVASDLMMHDVCDATDLWLVHNRSSFVMSYLKQLAASESDAAFKRHLEGLISSP